MFALAAWLARWSGNRALPKPATKEYGTGVPVASAVALFEPSIRIPTNNTARAVAARAGGSDPDGETRKICETSCSSEYSSDRIGELPGQKTEACMSGTTMTSDNRRALPEQAHSACPERTIAWGKSERYRQSRWDQALVVAPGGKDEGASANH